MALDTLKAEIARKRKQLQNTDVLSNRKFFRRGDLTAKEEEQYWHKYNEKRGQIGIIGQAVGIALNSSSKFIEQNEREFTLPRTEVIRRLRERNEPIFLFGENEGAALKRLRQLEIEAPEFKPGWRNDLQAAMTQVDAEYIEEILKLQQQDGTHDVALDEEQMTIDQIESMADELSAGDTASECDFVFTFFNFLLQEWGCELNSRPEEEKRSSRGKMILAQHRQTLEYLEPLFSKLKSKSCSADILEHLKNISLNMLDRNYIGANNSYMEMAIGNAPWPVGVTASGIHKRPGSEKFYVKNVAHVLNDETQRKYIQALKRLMTKCQQFYPTDPSRSVEFIPKR